LERIRAELAAATPGPWYPHVESHTDITDERWIQVEVRAENGVPGNGNLNTVATLGDDEVSEADATLIAHAPTYLAALLDIAEAAQERSDLSSRALFAAYGAGKSPGVTAMIRADKKLDAALTALQGEGEY
jgi:hypothetical protein